MIRFKTRKTRRDARKGQAVVEYALVLAFLASFCVAVLTPWGAPLRNLYIYIISALAYAAQYAAHGG
jgi:Flp pilus assembly pilin Flp